MTPRYLMALVARNGLGKIVAICADLPECEEYSSRFFAEWVGDGATVERLPYALAVAEINPEK